jgi:hypothetical protein
VLAQHADSTAALFTGRAPVAADPRLTLYVTYAPEAGNRANRAPTPRHLAESVRQATEHKRHWPEFALGGAVVGGVGLAGFAIVKCDAGCRDDGSLGGWLPALITVGAVGGAAIGTVIGLIVDSSRSSGP